MSQNIRVGFIPKSHQARRDLNKKLHEEQKSSLKNKAKNVGKTTIKIIKGIRKIASEYIEDTQESRKKFGRTISTVDKGLKSMGPSLKNTWVNPEKPTIKKKKKSKGMK